MTPLYTQLDQIIQSSQQDLQLSQNQDNDKQKPTTPQRGGLDQLEQGFVRAT